MNNKERCLALLDTFTEPQLANIVAMLQAVRNVVDDAVRVNNLDWDPDYTKLTESESLALSEAEQDLANGEMIPFDEIDWDA